MKLFFASLVLLVFGAPVSSRGQGCEALVKDARTLIAKRRFDDAIKKVEAAKGCAAQNDIDRLYQEVFAALKQQTQEAEKAKKQAITEKLRADAARDTALFLAGKSLRLQERLGRENSYPFLMENGENNFAGGNYRNALTYFANAEFFYPDSARATAAVLHAQSGLRADSLALAGALPEARAIFAELSRFFPQDSSYCTRLIAAIDASEMAFAQALAGKNPDTIKALVLQTDADTFFITQKLQALPDLKSLRISAGASRIEGLERLKNVQVLDLRGNQLHELPPGVFAIGGLKSLGLSQNSFPNFPTEIGRLAQLDSLDLSGNALMHLAPEIGQLKNLVYLDLSWNGLIDLPREIGQLTQLQTINLSGNDLRFLGNLLEPLAALERVDLSGNGLLDMSRGSFHLSPANRWKFVNLSGLPSFQYSAAVFYIQNLEYLKISDLRHTQPLPPEIGNLTRLRRLDLSGLELKNLPAELGKVTELESLNISGNGLEDLPPEMAQLAKLEYLDASKNPLRALTAVGSLAQLKHLDISQTSLTSLPPEIGNLTKLVYLDVSQSALAQLPPEMGRLVSLAYLNVSNTGLERFPPQIGSLINLTELNFARTTMEQFPPAVLRLPKLQRLNASNNYFSTGLPAEIGNLTALRNLNLSHTPLTQLPPEIGNLASLDTLDLYYCDLTQLPREIGRLKNLQVLRLTDNKLTDFPVEMQGLEKLQYLGAGCDYPGRHAGHCKEVSLTQMQWFWNKMPWCKVGTEGD